MNGRWITTTPESIEVLKRNSSASGVLVIDRALFCELVELIAKTGSQKPAVKFLREEDALLVDREHETSLGTKENFIHACWIELIAKDNQPRFLRMEFPDGSLIQALEDLDDKEFLNLCFGDRT
jgi:hypothetical protein